MVAGMEESGLKSETQSKNIVLAILSAAMFIYVVDTTIMNVSISALVGDLDTTVGEVQAAVTLYTLTMAAFMLTGGKLGDIWGSKRAFRIGLVIYGIGTTITALAPTIGFVMFGWSILEGLGSALIVPAINTLVRANFSGTKRASAYGTLFGVAAAGAAFGPLVGGWLTVNLSWRVAFAGEAIIVVILLLASGLLVDAPKVLPKPRLDVVGVVLSALGLGLFVLGVLQTSSRGWRDPVVAAMIVGGIAVLAAFVWWVKRQVARGRPALVHISIFRHRAISSGLPILATQTFAQAGLLFLIPVFTQAVLGFDAFETGLALLPLSIGVLLTSTTTPPLGRRIYPKYIIQVGLVLLFIGGFILSRALETATQGTDLALGLFVGGLAIGLVVGQLPNLILSGVEQDEAGEASGLQGTAQNLGMALGTAVIGSVIFATAILSFGNQIQASETIPDGIKAEVEQALVRPLERVGSVDLEEEIAALPGDIQDEVRTIESTAVRRGFQGAIIVGGIVALFGALLALRLPKKLLESDGSAESTVAEIVRSSPLPGLQLEAEDFGRHPDP
ncbi:MAG: MFS transporter [Acidobacteria bacterium]|nr:MAG: MFS transporter [Acidobacteriota bacterium]